MDKLKMHSVNKIEENIAAIGRLFPNCLTERMGENGEIETAIDFDALKQELSSAVVEGKTERYIVYDRTDGTYDNEIFTAEKPNQDYSKAFRATKAIQDYIFTDGTAENSVEKRFASSLEAAEEVCVYAKLPRGFAIPTPVGQYAPDWAIAFNQGTVKHIFFVAETKGTMSSLELRPIEQAKIKCARKLFKQLSNGKVVYHDVDSYENLLNVMKDL